MDGRKRGRGRGRGGRGRGVGRPRGTGTGRGRGRPRKMVIESDEEEIETSETVDNQIDLEDDGQEEMSVDERENHCPKPVEHEVDIPSSHEERVEYTLDDDISQLVPPTFSTVSKGPPQPMLELSWDHKYTPIGDRLPTPNVHMCVDCKLPIRIYGRLIPCKHVYCHACALKQNYCLSCSERVSRVEQAHLGQVFMCHYGGRPYGFEGCRRTYLSQRDLQAHVDHRHKPRGAGNQDHGGARISPVSAAVTSSHTIVSTPYDQSSYGRQNIPAHYTTAGGAGSQGNRTPSAQGSARPGDQTTPTGRYERRPSFNRNPSWTPYNNRQF